MVKTLIFSRYRLTIDDIWIGKRIYWTLTQHVATIYNSLSHTLVFSVTVFTALLGSGFQRRTFPFHTVPEPPPASATTFCSSQLSVSRTRNLLGLMSKSQSMSKSLYDWRFTVSQFVLVSSPLRRITRDLFFNWTFAVIVLVYYHPWREDESVSYEYAWPFGLMTAGPRYIEPRYELHRKHFSQ
jgi:hypothetical protein